MKDLSISVKSLFATILEYLENGKYKTPFKIVLLLLSALMIYTAGKISGELIYHVTSLKLL